MKGERTHKQRDNYGTGLTECFKSCKCIECRNKKVKGVSDAFKRRNK